MQDIDMEMFSTEAPIAKEKIEYRILYQSSHFLSDALDKLEQEVNNLLKYGWRPQGGISIAEADNSINKYKVCQAMCKVQNSGGL